MAQFKPDSDELNFANRPADIFNKLLNGAVISGSFLKTLFSSSEAHISTNRLADNPDAFFGGHAIMFITKPEINVDEAGNMRKEPEAGFKDGTDKGAVVTAKEKIDRSVEELGNIWKKVPNLLNDITFGGFYGLSSDPELEQIVELPSIAGSQLATTNNQIFIPELSENLKGVQFQNIGVTYDSFITNLQQSKYMAPIKLDGESGVTFTMTFTEDSEAKITKILKLWTEYINAVTTGTADAIPSIRNIIENVIDYKSSVYVFLTKPNLTEITFYAKYTGVIPSNIPISMLTFNVEEQNELKLDVDFIADAFTYLDEKIISEFNSLIAHTGVLIVPNLNSKHKSYKFESNLAGCDASAGRIDKCDLLNKTEKK